MLKTSPVSSKLCMTDECAWWNAGGNDCSIRLGINKWVAHLEEFDRFKFFPVQDSSIDNCQSSETKVHI